MKKQTTVSLIGLEDRADQFIEEGKFREAEILLKRLLENDNNDIIAHFNLARVYRTTKQYENALYHDEEASGEGDSRGKEQNESSGKPGRKG